MIGFCTTVRNGRCRNDTSKWLVIKEAKDARCIKEARKEMFLFYDALNMFYFRSND